VDKESKMNLEDVLEKYKKLQNEHILTLNRLIELEKSDNARHAIIYNYIPVSIWEEDFSGVYEYLESINFKEIEDFKLYLDQNFKVVFESLKRVIILDLNDHSAKLYKLKDKNELINRFQELFSESTLEAFKKELIAMQQGKQYLELDAVISDIEGIKHDIFLQWIVLPGYEENYKRVMITTIDVSEIKQAERERLKLLEQFQQKQKLESLGLFAGGIAHDFNNILFGISGNAELAKINLYRPHLSNQYLENILNLVNKASQVTNQILSFAGKNTQTKEIININSELRNILELFDVFLDKKTIILLNLNEEDIFIELNSGQFNQILVNLVSNAAEATKDKIGTITISTGIVVEEDNKKSVKLSIKDNGRGISKENIERIFDPFFSTKKEGRGLGLSVVHGIINSYNGSITVQSEFGKYSEFIIKLPIVENIRVEQEKNYLIDNENIAKKTENKRKIFICEDGSDIRKILKIYLESNGFETETSIDGEAGYNHLIKHSDYDLIIIDLNMPKLGGIELLRKLQDVGIFFPTILTSGDQINLENFDFNTKIKFLSKPYSLKSLLDEINELTT
jgi:signal transduction histidine kinase/CheY-like chemotaxis protein